MHTLARSKNFVPRWVYAYRDRGLEAVRPQRQSGRPPKLLDSQEPSFRKRVLYSPELNPVERLWAYLRSHYLSNRAYQDYTDLFNACGQAWNQLTAQQLCAICRTGWIPHEN